MAVLGRIREGYGEDATEQSGIVPDMALLVGFVLPLTIDDPTGGRERHVRECVPDRNRKVRLLVDWDRYRHLLGPLPRSVIQMLFGELLRCKCKFGNYFSERGVIMPAGLQTLNRRHSQH